jgi:fibronectin-binding autotransporter adhesin
MLMGQSTLYWDTNGATAGVGGTGTWQDLAGNWSTNSSGTDATTWTNANRDNAFFDGTGGVVTVDGDVEVRYMRIVDGSYTFTGDTITLGSLTASGDYTVFDSYSAGTTTFDSAIVINTPSSASTNEAEYIFKQRTAGGILNINGDISIDFDGTATTNTKAIEFTTEGTAATVNVAGSIQASTDVPSNRLAIWVGDSSATSGDGQYYFTGDNSDVGREFRIVGGSVFINSDNAVGTGGIRFGVSTSQGDQALYTTGAITVSNTLSNGGGAGSMVIGGSTAHESTFSGNFNMNSFDTTPGATLTAASGGRVNFSGNLYSNDTDSTQDLTIDGAGVVALTRAEGNVYHSSTNVENGTLLLMNTSGSATGDGSTSLETAAVNIASGAQLGGTGSSAVQVIAAAADSVITAGDMTKEGLSSIGTLSLDGGMTAANGATFKVDIDGASIDMVDFGAADIDLDGLLTFDFENLGTVDVGITYSLFAGSGDWTGSDATFAFNGPDGYILDSGYGSGDGYLWDAAGNSLTVKFAAIPEPGIFALLAGCVGFSMVMLRRRV